MTWVGAIVSSSRIPSSVMVQSTPRPSSGDLSRVTRPAFSSRFTVWVTLLRLCRTESASCAIRSRQPSRSESRTRISYSASEMP